eukprot:1138719-Pelagomonas_calceolata.AAC.1
MLNVQGCQNPCNKGQVHSKSVDSTIKLICECAGPSSDSDLLFCTASASGCCQLPLPSFVPPQGLLALHCHSSAPKHFKESSMFQIKT